MPKREGSPLLPSLIPARHAAQLARKHAPQAAAAPAQPAPGAAAGALAERRFALPAGQLALMLRRLRQAVTVRDGPASPAAPWAGAQFRARRLAQDALFCCTDALQAARNRRRFADAVARRLREFKPDAQR